MNKVKYILINGNDVLGMVYESDEFGRTMVIGKSISPDFLIEVFDIEKQEVVKEFDFINYINSMIPRKS